MTKTVKTLAVVLSVALLLFASCSGGGSSGGASSAPAPAAKEKVTFRVGAGHPATFSWIKILDTYFIPEVTKRAADKYEIEWIKAYGGSVMKLGEELTGIESGLVDIGATIYVFEPARLMLHGFTYRLPFSCGDPLVVSKVMKQLYKEFPVFVTEFEKFNQKLLGVAVTDPYTLFSTKPVKSLSDVKGMKIGAAGANLTWVQDSGAVPVQTNLNECYQSLQTNVYAGTIMPMGASVNAQKLPEVAPYIIDANFNCVIHNSIAINLDKWKSLKPDLQNILVEVGKEYEDVQAKDVADGYAKDVEKVKAAGIDVYTLPREEQVKWAASLPDVPSVMVKELNERGYPGNAIAKRYLELLAENGWPKIREWKID